MKDEKAICLFVVMIAGTHLANRIKEQEINNINEHIQLLYTMYNSAFTALVTTVMEPDPPTFNLSAAS